jgi:protein-S-isoprenylcysteine O-methyltransferase Ste14
MSDEAMLIRRGVVCASGIIYWVGVLIQARRVRRHIGRSPNLKPRGKKERLLWVGWFLVILAWILQPIFIRIPGANGADGLWSLELGLWTSWLNPISIVLGLILMIVGYSGTLWCYRAMGDSWRIGVNKQEKNALVTLGPYRAIRHPIYAFQVVMLAGALLLLPTTSSAAILAFHLGCVLIKAADEEAYLLSIHGQPYQHYLSRTGRLLPKM